MSTNEILALVVAYLIGSVPFGVIVAKFSGIGDITKQGSGNIGATNVARVGGKKLGAVTLILDGVKGVIAILIAKAVFPGNAELHYMVGLAAVLGHLFPVFLKFKGGKGVATTFGVVLLFSPVTGFITLLTWLSAFVLSKISSLSALAAVSLMPVFAFLFEKQLGVHFLALTIILSVLVFVKHHQNIVRLLNGTEGNFKKKS